MERGNAPAHHKALWTGFGKTGPKLRPAAAIRALPWEMYMIKGGTGRIPFPAGPMRILARIVRGKECCSPRVTQERREAPWRRDGDRLRRDFGIPVGCCADGPSGIRMDCGTHAFSLPNGTCPGL